jgi:serine protease Do
MEDLQLAVDGTMSEYCDILRSHVPSDVLDIEVYRPAIDAVLAGQLNGRELEVITSFAAELDDEVGGEEDPGVGSVTYTDYMFITDDSSLIEVSVPVEWSDTLGEPWNFDGDLIGPALSAAPDRDAWLSGWDTPGVFIGASAQLTMTVDQLLDGQDFSGACTYVDRYPYDDGLYFGSFDFWEDCGGVGSFIVVAAEPADGAFIVLVQIIAVTDADLDAADEVFGTFQILGDLAG